jgi:hypothetical protein
MVAVWEADALDVDAYSQRLLAGGSISELIGAEAADHATTFPSEPRYAARADLLSLGRGRSRRALILINLATAAWVYYFLAFAAPALAALIHGEIAHSGRVKSACAVDSRCILTA